MFIASGMLYRISSTDTLFSFCPQSFPASGTFPKSCLFASGDQNTEASASASASVFLVNIQGWSPLRLTGLISLLSKGLSGVFSSTTVLWPSAVLVIQLSQPYKTTGKTTVFTIWTFVSRVMCLLFNTLSRFVITFPPRSSPLLILWLQSPSTVILEPKKRKFVTTSTFSTFICHAVMGLVAMILVFLICSFKLAFSLSSFTLIKRLFNSSLLSAIRVVSATCLRLLIFLLPVLIPACNSSSLAFLIMCSVYRLNKQGDSRQPCCTPFLILNQSVVPYRVLTVAS